MLLPVPERERSLELRGAARGCAGAMMAHGADELLGASGGNLAAQCGIAAVAAAGTYYGATSGGQRQLGQAAWGAGGGCVGGAFGWITKTLMAQDPNANTSANTIAGCSVSGASAVGFAVGRNSTWSNVLQQGAVSCVTGASPRRCLKVRRTDEHVT